MTQVSSILHIIKTKGPISTKQIQIHLTREYNSSLDKETINSILYGQLHELVIRDKDEDGFPIWRAKTAIFQAAKGLEVLLYRELSNRKIISEQTAKLDYQVHNRKNNKTYFLDIAIFQNEQKYNIEIDGFEHMRADARISIQKQIQAKKAAIDIDWMDNKTSYADFKQIDNNKLFKWCAKNHTWCIKYHEELLKPHDITRNIWLIDNGWKIIRFWNFEIKENLGRCIKDIKDWIEK